MNDKFGKKIDIKSRLRRNKDNLLNVLSHLINKIESKIWQTVLERTYRNVEDIFFVEIGGWDGIGCDPLHKFIVRHKPDGICIEPQKIGFQKLQGTYREHPNIILENVAISEKDGTTALYTILSQNGQIAGGQSTLNEDIALEKIKLAREHQNESQQLLVKEIVSCATLDSVLKKNKVKKIDILQIDTEGSDCEIIKAIPFHIMKPKLIRFERVYLSKGDEKKVVALLKKQGYCLVKAGIDYIAIEDLRGVRILILILKICQGVYNKSVHYSHMLSIKWS